MKTVEFLQYRDSLLKKLLDTTDMSILKRVEKAFNSDEEDFFDELPEEVQDGILKSIEQSKKGLGRPIQDVLEELK